MIRLSIVTPESIRARQNAWCDGLVRLSDDLHNDELTQEQRRALTEDFVRANYTKRILFKPTLAQPPNTVRTNLEGASSYFVGGDDTYGDSGFAKKYRWSHCKMGKGHGLRLSPSVVIVSQPVSLYYRDKEGSVHSTTVDKTWTFVGDERENGVPKIAQHHSSPQFT